MFMEQNYKNHVRYVPVFHFFVLPMLLINFVWSVRVAKHDFSADTVIASLTALALILAALYGRMFALAVQNRVIRLEMRLRLQELLPADLRGRIVEFRPGQLVALRFASDAELPGLARKVLDEKLIDQKAIKQLIRDWQPDFLRA
jgi:uncharacterized membrane protein YciS (DUF1049 family)